MVFIGILEFSGCSIGRNAEFVCADAAQRDTTRSQPFESPKPKALFAHFFQIGSSIKIGFINEEGEIIIKPRFDRPIGEFDGPGLSAII